MQTVRSKAFNNNHTIMYMVLIDTLASSLQLLQPFLLEYSI